MTFPTPPNPLDRFVKYTSGKEPVITVNVIAAVLMASFVKVVEETTSFQWDELSLTVVGILFLSGATWLARKGVFSPFTHEQEVEDALFEEPPEAV